MKTRDLLGFSLTALRGHRLRTWLSLIGVGIGVASVIMLTSLGEGARLYVTGEFSSLGSNLLIFLPGKTETRGAMPVIGGVAHDLTVEDAEALRRRIPQIERVAPISLGTAAVSYGDRRREVTVIGTTHDILKVRGLRVGAGRFLPEGERDAPVCVLGARVQRELFGNQNPLGEMVRLGDTRLRIIGTLAPRGTSIGMNLDEVVEIPVDTAMRMFNRTGLFRLMAQVRSHAALEPARRAILATLKERHDNQEDVTVLTQDAVLATFNQILSLLTAVLTGIAAVSLTVAGIGIMNVMLVSVSERTTEIGLLKAVGVTTPQIVQVFLLEAALLSTSGGLLGLAVGIGAGKFLQHMYPDFPVRPPWWAVVAALVVSIAVGLVFGSMPARRAARLDPVEALMRRRA
jgi:putative ABC transport system permease protein